ncbi:MAG: diphthine--ammonia ligase [Candidatus ainarchaeum sp.]|nr:diphthine--ammonia ligase [Candidatus ainarchaeum sp.]
MCGIAGFFGFEDSFEKARKAVFEIRERGIDGFGFSNGRQIVFEKELEKIPVLEGKNCVAHCLHSLVGFVSQPLKGKGLLIANCEIYNWKELNEKNGFGAKNDAELLLKLIEKNGLGKIKETLEELDGTYAFAYWLGGKVIIARDLLGIKPLNYSLEKGFAFASERKALEAAGISGIIDLNPRQILEFNIKTKKIRIIKRNFFETAEKKFSEKEAVEKLLSVLGEAVKKRVPEKKFGLLFSGGIDSTAIALILKRLGCDFKCYFAFAEGKELGIPRDIAFAKKISETLGLKLEIVPASMEKTEECLKKIVPLIESSNPMKAGVALPFFVACEKARADGIKAMFSGLGSDELFAGYKRFSRSNDLNEDSRNLLLQMYENDFYRDDIVLMHHNIELRLPFLDKKVVEFALQLPRELKIKGKTNKLVLRKAAESIGLPEEFAFRGKTSAQYGSNFDKAIEKIARKKGFGQKTVFLNSLAKKKNLKLGVLFSGGKDSCLALWLMKQQNYEISCLISMQSKNQDSFMFHKPDGKILKMQSEASGIPIVIGATKGEKEKELLDFKKTIVTAKKKFCLDGIVSGAVYSNYQRKRIQAIAEELGLKVFSPLWHWKQGDVLKTLLNWKFEFVLSKIAAKGLDEKILGKTIFWKETNFLLNLEKKTGFNAAGEGGEFESIILDAPFFKKKILLGETAKKMRNECTGELLIKKAFFVEKNFFEALADARFQKVYKKNASKL